MFNMFGNCGKLQYLDIQNFNIVNVTEWTGMFLGVQSNIEIITNTDTEAWLREKFPNLTNIHQ